MHRVTVIFNRIIFAMLALSCAGLALAKNEPSPAVVGEVSLLLGKATVSNAVGYTVPASVGLAIHAGDTIETASSGHVHIRFVDDALVSVRPLSILEVVRYDYSPQNPQNSAVKLNLVEGITRAISGQAAKQARQNFRLNTPIAAIGVRGTDFAVSADSQSVRAFVNEGSILVAPYSSQCSADALGPCSQSKNAVELSGLSRQILEMNASTSGISAALLPATTAQAQALVAEAAVKADNGNKTAKASEAKDLYSDTVTSRTVNTTLANNESMKPVEAAPPVTSPVTPPVTPPAVVVVTPPPVTPPEVIPAPPAVVVTLPVVPVVTFTPAVAEPSAALLSSDNGQLVWGRYSNANLDSERITVLYDPAHTLEILNGRQDTVGDQKHVLFRTGAPGQTVQPGLGVLAFSLNKAQVQYTSAGKVELMQVNGGQLSLDFVEAKFSTSLQLNHSATGDITFAESGNIFYGEFFTSNGETQSMAGTVSLDGKEAGYFFEKTLAKGTVEGLTLWSRKP